MKKILYILIVISLSFACNDSNKSTSNTVELPPKELLEKRKKNFSEFKVELKQKIRETQKFSELKQYLSKSFTYYVTEYVDDKSKVIIRVSEKNAFEKFNKHIDLDEVKFVIINGNQDVSSGIANIYYFKGKKTYPTIDIIYNENQEKWEIDEIKYIAE